MSLTTLLKLPDNHECERDADKLTFRRPVKFMLFSCYETHIANKPQNGRICKQRIRNKCIKC